MFRSKIKENDRTYYIIVNYFPTLFTKTVKGVKQGVKTREPKSQAEYNLTPERESHRKWWRHNNHTWRSPLPSDGPTEEAERNYKQ